MRTFTLPTGVSAGPFCEQLLSKSAKALPSINAGSETSQDTNGAVGSPEIGAEPLRRSSLPPAVSIAEGMSSRFEEIWNGWQPSLVVQTMKVPIKRVSDSLPSH